MKIAYLSNTSIPSRTANSVHIMEMCAAFEKSGHTTMLFANVTDSSSESYIFKYYGVENKFAIFKRLSFLNFKFLAHLNGIYIALVSKLKRPDFIISRDITSCFFATLFGLDVYFETHGPMVESGRLSHFLFKRVIRAARFRKFIVITHALANYYEKNYSSLKGKILVLPDGANEVDLTSIKPIHIKKEGLLNVGYTGHLYPGKGMEVISKLAPRLSSSVHFHIVGGRDEEIDYWKKEIGSPNVTFHGFVPHAEVKNYIAELDILLLPNQRKVGSNAGRDIGQWTSPLKLFEYMALEKPIICSDLEVLKEIVKHGENGYLCDPENIDEWQEAIEFLNRNRNVSTKMGATALHDLKLNYTWVKRCNKIIQDFLS